MNPPIVGDDLSTIPRVIPGQRLAALSLKRRNQGERQARRQHAASNTPINGQLNDSFIPAVARGRYPDVNDETRTTRRAGRSTGIDGYHTQGPGWITHAAAGRLDGRRDVGWFRVERSVDGLEASAVEALRRQVIALQRISSLGVLAGGVFHELNNALTPILNYAKLGLRNPDPAYRERALTQIVEAAQRAATITRGCSVCRGRETSSTASRPTWRGWSRKSSCSSRKTWRGTGCGWN